MTQSELGVRTSAVTRLAAVMEAASEEFVRNLTHPDGASDEIAALSPEALKREVLGAVKLLERAQVQVGAAMHLAGGVALSVEAEEQERLLDLPLDEKIGRGKGGHGRKHGNGGTGAGRGKHEDAFTVTPPTNVHVHSSASASATDAGTCASDSADDAFTVTPPTNSNTTGSADQAFGSATEFPRGSAFIPGFSSHDVSDSECEFPRVWCGVSVKAMDEALWGLGSELALMWGRSEFVTTGMLIDTATLTRLPKLEARFITGQLNGRLVKTVVKHCVGLTDEQAASYDTRLHEFLFPAKYEVTGHYPVRSAADVARFAEITRNRLHAEPLAVREKREMKHRYVSISNESNGMCSINGLLPATAAHRFMNTLTDFAITAKAENDTRTLKQLIADVFTDLITHNYNHSYPNTPPDPARPEGNGGAEGTSAPETGFEPTAGPEAWPPDDPDATDTAPGGSAPAEKLSYDSIHDLFDHTTTPENTCTHKSSSGFRGTIAPTTGAEGTSAPDSSDTDGFTVDADGVIHDHTDETTQIDPVTDTEVGADGGAGSGSGSRSGLRGEAKIFVTIPATTLAGLDDQDGMLAGYGPIPADTIRELAGSAFMLYRMFTDPDTGRPLALGRSSYRVDTQLREFLQLRSDTCQFPGCGVSARRTDADHIHEWDAGGETNPENLQLLCRKHHNLKTHYRWDATVIDPESNTIQWTSPLGNIYLTEPVGTGTGTIVDAGTKTGAGIGTGTGVDPWSTPRDNNSDSAGARSNSNSGALGDLSNPAPWTFEAQQNTQAANGPCFKCMRHECSTPGHDNRIGPFNDHSFGYQNSLAEGYLPIQGPLNKPAPIPPHHANTADDDNPPF